MNIIHIFCDELRQDALECCGNPVGHMYTPNIDSIAEKGYLFDNCFCNSPVCVPSRTSMLTGLYPEDTGVYHNEGALSPFVMPRQVDTYPEVLCRAGYRTASFGKTHIPRQMHPFEVEDPAGGEMNLGLTPGEMNAIDKLSPGGNSFLCIAGLYPEKNYGPEQVTANALEWMTKQSEPYYVRFSYLQPHTPVIVKRGYESVYEGYPFSGALPDISGLSRFEQEFASILRAKDLKEEELVRSKVYYYGMVHWVDDQVGQILAFLRDRGEDAIIIINSDHGALRGECQGLSKQIFHRSAHAVPLIIYDPRRPGGKRISQLCSNIDLARTLFGMLGIEAPAQFKGVDLFTNTAPETVYATIGFGEVDSFALPMIRLGRFENDGGWPRRACIRQGTYRLDMTIRQDGRYVGEDQEDIFFVDTAICQDEDRNMANEPLLREVVAPLRRELRNHCGII